MSGSGTSQVPLISVVMGGGLLCLIQNPNLGDGWLTVFHCVSSYLCSDPMETGSTRG